MRHRAEELGGTWSIEPGVGGGTRVVATLPVHERHRRRPPPRSSSPTTIRSSVAACGRCSPRPVTSTSSARRRPATRRWPSRSTWSRTSSSWTCRCPGHERHRRHAADHRQAPTVDILVLTMFDDDDSVFAAVRAGPRGYLLKDADQDDLVRAIRAVAAATPSSAPASPSGCGRSSPATCPRRPRSRDLTGREVEILDLIAAGRTTPRSPSGSASPPRPSGTRRRTSSSSCTPPIAPRP